MRGEEVQAVGVIALDRAIKAICHPGTHSKHIAIDNGSIVGFTTHMTGELFAVLREQSILGRTMTARANPSSKAFQSTTAEGSPAPGNRRQNRPPELKSLAKIKLAIPAQAHGFMTILGVEIGKQKRHSP